MRLLAPLAALLISACATPQAAAPRPALWKVADADTTIYLFGTIHVLPDGYDWTTPKIDKAIADADTLALEIADQNAPGASERYLKLATSPGLPPLAERVPEAQRPALQKLMAKAGFEPGQLDRLETWAAAITLGVALYADIGARAENGVEKTLSSRFEGKKVVGLETTAQQLGYFDALPEASQRRLLTSILEEADGSSAEFEAMTNAWSKGDVRKIAVTFDDELRLSPDLADVLLRQRNARWAEWVKARLDEPGTVLVAVGAGHLAGADSVQAMLEAKGVTVKRVQ